MKMWVSHARCSLIAQILDTAKPTALDRLLKPFSLDKSIPGFRHRAKRLAQLIEPAVTDS